MGTGRTNTFSRSPFETDPRLDVRSSVESIARLLRPEDLSVVFQPIVHMESLRVFAYEALVRCRVPGLTNPSVLFERAVKDGCVGRLGRMVREVATPLVAGLPVFLNVHPKELEERWLVRPDDPMFFHNHDVYVEITESVPFTHFELVRDVLKEIRSRGNVHLVVDDLGAGYSNLKRIADLQPRVVKLDRGLIVDVTRGSRQQRLVANVVQLCVDMGAEVVVEGIETVDEWLAIADTGAHYAQGFLFARPGFPLPPVSVSSQFEVAWNARNAAQRTLTVTAPSTPPSRVAHTPLPMRAPSIPPTREATPTAAMRAVAPARDLRTPMPMRAPSIPPVREVRTPLPMRAPLVSPVTPTSVSPVAAPKRDTRAMMLTPPQLPQTPEAPATATDLLPPRR